MLTHHPPIKTSQLITSTMLPHQYYHLPHHALRDCISHYTFIHAPSKEASSRLCPHSSLSTPTQDKSLHIIPDGSGCFIFSYHKGRLSSRCWCPTTKPECVSINDLSGEDWMFFIELKPTGMYQLTRVNQDGLADSQYDLEQLAKKMTLQLETLFYKAPSLKVLIHLMDTFFLQQLDHKAPLTTYVAHALQLLDQHHGHYPIRDLAKDLFVSQRHLGRLFKQQTGLTLKQHAKILRLNRIISHFKQHPLKLSLYPHTEEYFYDDAHFIRDFKSICGTTPGYFINNMSTFYNEPFKF